jgi:hypothetical protein
MPSNSDLWQRIQGFEIDNPNDELPYSSRLARENGWSAATAAAAIEEYRKFIYLLCVTDTPLTPSESVDQVWHLHLVYTRSYWTAFCGDVLGRPLHHAPTRGGEAQAALFKEQYALTLARYETEFGDAPPAEFWPAEPFGALPSQRWVDRRTHWIVPKRVGRHLAQGGMFIAVIALMASCGMHSGAHATEASSHTGFFGRMLALAIPVGLIALVVAVTRPPDNRDAGTDGGIGFGFGGCVGGGCSGGCGGGCGGCGGCGE